MNVKYYLKNVLKAVLNKKTYYSNEREYIINNSDARLKGKVAVVTGAGGAIGGAIAYRLAHEGARVYLCGRNINKLNGICSDMDNKGLSAAALKLDVTDIESIRCAKDIFLRDGQQTLDILVNCAGGSTRNRCAELVDQKIEMIDEMLNVNLRGSMLCTKEFGKIMVNQGYGKIVNISSVIGEHGKVKFTDYAAAKAGIIGYTKSVAQELGPKGVTINCVSPGYIQRGAFSEEMLPYLLNSNFLNRVGSAEDVAAAVAFLVSDDAAFITGQNLCVDGGRSLGLHGD